MVGLAELVTAAGRVPERKTAAGAKETSTLSLNIEI
jgi:hypothetical protein